MRNRFAFYNPRKKIIALLFVMLAAVGMFFVVKNKFFASENPYYTGPRNISGMVYDNETKKPLWDAAIYLGSYKTGSALKVARSGVNGSYFFSQTDISEDYVYLLISKEGYMSLTGTITYKAAPKDVIINAVLKLGNGAETVQILPIAKGNTSSIGLSVQPVDDSPFGLTSIEPDGNSFRANKYSGLMTGYNFADDRYRGSNAWPQTLTNAGQLPSELFGASAIYNSTNDLYYVIAGRSRDGISSQDIFEYDRNKSDRAQSVAKLPFGGAGSASIYLPEKDLIIIFLSKNYEYPTSPDGAAYAFSPTNKKVYALGPIEKGDRQQVIRDGDNNLYLMTDLDDQRTLFSKIKIADINVTDSCLVGKGTYCAPYINETVIDTVSLVGATAYYSNFNNRISLIGGKKDGEIQNSIYEIDLISSLKTIKPSLSSRTLISPIAYAKIHRNDSWNRIYLYGGVTKNSVPAMDTLLQFDDNRSEKYLIGRGAINLQFPYDIGGYASAQDASNRSFIFSSNNLSGEAANYILRMGTAVSLSAGGVYQIPVSVNTTFIVKGFDQQENKYYAFNTPRKSVSLAIPYNSNRNLTNENIVLNTVQGKYRLIDAYAKGIISSVSLNGENVILSGGLPNADALVNFDSLCKMPRAQANEVSVINYLPGATILLNSNIELTGIELDEQCENQIYDIVSLDTDCLGTIVEWRTTNPSFSYIEWGNSPGSYNFTDIEVFTEKRKTNFSVNIPSRFEKIYYRIKATEIDAMNLSPEDYIYSDEFTIESNVCGVEIDADTFFIGRNDKTATAGTVYFQTVNINQPPYENLDDPRGFSYYMAIADCRMNLTELANPYIDLGEQYDLNTVFHDYSYYDFFPGKEYTLYARCYYPGHMTTGDDLTAIPDENYFADSKAINFKWPCPTIEKLEEIEITSNLARFEAIADSEKLYGKINYSVEGSNNWQTTNFDSRINIELTNLEPDTKYLYSIPPGDEEIQKVCPSFEGEFKTKKELLVITQSATDQNELALDFTSSGENFSQVPSFTIKDASDGVVVEAIDQGSIPQNCQDTPTCGVIIDLNEDLCKYIDGDETKHDFVIDYTATTTDGATYTDSQNFSLNLLSTCIKTLTVEDPIYDYTAHTVKLKWTTDIPAQGLLKYGLTTDYNKFIGANELKTTQEITLKTDGETPDIEKGNEYHFQIETYTNPKYTQKTSDDKTFLYGNKEITDIQVSEITTTTAKISWKTGLESTGQVNYGLTTDYGKTTELTTAGTSHSIILTDLTKGSTYHFRIIVRYPDNLDELVLSTDQTFETSSTDDCFNCPEGTYCYDGQNCQAYPPTVSPEIVGPVTFTYLETSECSNLPPSTGDICARIDYNTDIPSAGFAKLYSYFDHEDHLIDSETQICGVSHRTKPFSIPVFNASDYGYIYINGYACDPPSGSNGGSFPSITFYIGKDYPSKPSACVYNCSAPSSTPLLDATVLPEINTTLEPSFDTIESGETVDKAIASAVWGVSKDQLFNTIEMKRINKTNQFSAILPVKKAHTYYYKIVRTDKDGNKEYSETQTLKYGHWLPRFFNDTFANFWHWLKNLF